MAVDPAKPDTTAAPPVTVQPAKPATPPVAPPATPPVTPPVTPPAVPAFRPRGDNKKTDKPTGTNPPVTTPGYSRLTPEQQAIEDNWKGGAGNLTDAEIKKGVDQGLIQPKETWMWDVQNKTYTTKYLPIGYKDEWTPQGLVHTPIYKPGEVNPLLPPPGTEFLTLEQQLAAREKIAVLNKKYANWKQLVGVSAALQKAPDLKNYPGLISALANGQNLTKKNVKVYGAIGSLVQQFPFLQSMPNVLGALVSGQTMTKALLLENKIPEKDIAGILKAQTIYHQFTIPEHEISGILKAQSAYRAAVHANDHYKTYYEYFVGTHEAHSFGEFVAGFSNAVGSSLQHIVDDIPGGHWVEGHIVMPVVGLLGSILGSHPMVWLDHLVHGWRDNKGITDAGGPAAVAGLDIAAPILDFITGLGTTGQHLYRAYETMKALHGEAAALELLMPTILGAGAGMAFGLALDAIPGAEGAGVAVDVAEAGALAADAASAATIAGEVATAAGEIASTSRLVSAIRTLMDAAKAVKDLKNLALAPLEETDAYKSFVQAKSAIERLLKPITDVTKPVVDITGKVINKYSIAGAQIGTQIGGQFHLQPFSEIWAQTADGTKWAHDHPNMAPTLGQNLFGEHNFASGVVDFMVAMSSQSPYTAAGSFRRDIQSVEGLALKIPFTDNILHVWSGTAFANVDKAYEQYGKVRRSIDAIVEHIASPSEIARIDKRLEPVAGILSDAKVLHKVDSERGLKGTIDKEATLRNVKDVFKQLSATDEIFSTGKLPMNSAALLRLRQSGIGKQGIFTFMPMLPDFTGPISEWGIRTKEFTLGDPAALGPLARGLRQIGIAEPIVKAMIDRLYVTRDLSEWMNAYKTVVKGKLQIAMVGALIGERAADKLGPDVIDSFLKHFDAQINKAIDDAANHITGFGGVSKKGAYAMGADGADLSRVIKVGTAGSHTTAVYEGQLGRVHFPSYVEYNKSVHDLVKILQNSSSIKEMDISLKKALGKEYEAMARDAAEGIKTIPSVYRKGTRFANETYAKSVKEFEDEMAAAEAERIAQEHAADKALADEARAKTQKIAAQRARPIGERTTKGATQGIISRVVREQANQERKWQKYIDSGDYEKAAKVNRISDQEIADLTKFLEQVGFAQFEGVSLRISQREGAGYNGLYDFVDNVIRLRGEAFTQGGMNRTLIHELFHHLSQYLPEEHLTGLDRELQSARVAFIRQSGLEKMVQAGRELGYLPENDLLPLPKVSEARELQQERFIKLASTLNAHKSMQDTQWGVKGWEHRTAYIHPDKIDWADLPAISGLDNYRLNSLDEWFAESMYDRAAGELSAKRNALVEFGHKIMQAIYASINRVSGYKAGEAAFREFWNGRYTEKLSNVPLEWRINPDMASWVSYRKTPLTGDEMGATFAEGHPATSEDNWFDGKAMQNLRYKWDATKGGSAHVMQLIDRMVNDNFFKPLALATGGWATRVSASEMLLNAMRQGPINMGLARFAAAGARHERAVKYWGKDLDRKGVLDVASRVGYVISRQMRIGGDYALRNVDTDYIEKEIANLTKRLAKDPKNPEELAKFRENQDKFNRYNKELNLRNNLKVFSSDEEMGHFVAVLHGMMAGAEASILKGLGKQEFMDAAILSLYLNDGHLAPQMLEGGHTMVNDRSLPRKGSVLSVDAALHAEGVVADHVIQQRALFEMRYAHKARLSTSGDFQHIGSGNEGFIVSRLYQADMQASDKAMQYALKDMLRKYDEKIAAGATQKEAYDAAAIEGVASHYEFMQSLPKATRELFDRQTGWVTQNAEFGAAFPTVDPGINHSYTAIEGLKSTLWGAMSVKSLGGKPYFDETLFRDMANNEVVNSSWQEFAKKYHTSEEGRHLGPEYFSPVIGPKVNHISWSELLPTHASQWLNEKVTGRIVSRLSREPTFIVDFANELRNSRRDVGKGLTEEQAQTQAMARASYKMIRFVHNPYDKIKFEYGMRMVAPFYFAQNQAWRRTFRLLGEDVGAFERYTWTIGQALTFSYNAGKSSGGYPTITLPFSNDIMGFVTKFLTGTSTPLGIDLALSSAQSVLPISPMDTTDPQNPLSSPATLIHSLIPRTGPLVIWPLKYVLPSLGVLTPEELQRFDDLVIGPAGESTSMIQDALPNSFLDHIAQVTLGYVGAKWAGHGGNAFKGTGFISSFISASNESWRYMIQKKFEEMDATIRHAYKDQHLSETAISNAVLYNFTQYYNTGTVDGQKHFDQLMNDVADTAATRGFVRAGVGFFSPLSTSMAPANRKFSQEYQNLVNTLNGDMVTAQVQWFKRNPDKAPYTITNSTSKGFPGAVAPGTSWPTTKNGLQWMQKNFKGVDQYPSAFRYLMPLNTLESATNSYNSLAQLYQMQHQFRAKNMPADMMTQLNVSIGNYYFYDVVVPAYEAAYKKYNPNATAQQIAYAAYNGNASQNFMGAKQWAQQNGMSVNADWANQFAPGNTVGDRNRQRTLNQVAELVVDPKYKSMPGMSNLKGAYDLYQWFKTTPAAEGGAVGATTTQRGEMWANYIAQIKVKYPSLQPFITDVLAPIYPNLTVTSGATP